MKRLLDAAAGCVWRREAPGRELALEIPSHYNDVIYLVEY
jgi:hypothetical protein